MLSNERAIFQNQNNKINELLILNEAYKNKISQYENIFNNLESQIHHLKVIRQNSILKEEIYQNEILDNAKKDQKILELENDIINLKTKKN